MPTQAIPHPGPPPSSIPPFAEEKNSRPKPDALKEMHRFSITNFLNPETFGLFKNRQKVAGFIPHRFSEVPSMQESWKVDAINLVGLLMHDEPVAYLSDHLPRMEELKNAPTRPLDDFEKIGLTKIRQGEAYYLASTADCLRMLGPIHALKQCTACQDCQRGDLLGAFAYTLRKVEK